MYQALNALFFGIPKQEVRNITGQIIRRMAMMGKVAKAGKVCKAIKHGTVMFVATNRIYGVSQRIFTTVLSRDKKAIFTYKPRSRLAEYN